MIILLLVLCILIPVVAGSAVLLMFMHRWSQVREEQLRALRESNDHQNALRAIQMAKAWDQAMKPDPTPQLERPQEVVITPTEIRQPLTYEQLVKNGYRPEEVRRYLQEQDGRRHGG